MCHIRLSLRNFIPYGPNSSDSERISANKNTRRHKITVKVNFCTIFIGYIHKHSECLCTRDVGVLLGVESQLVLCGQVDEGLHGGEVGDVSVTDLTEQRLQVPAQTQTLHQQQLLLFAPSPFRQEYHLL